MTAQAPSTMGARATAVVSLEDIRVAVCAEFGLDDTAFACRRRRERGYVARHCAFWLAREMTRHSLPEIAGAFGRYHHTTVMLGIAAHARRMRRDAALRNASLRLRSALEEGRAPVGPVLLRSATFAELRPFADARGVSAADLARRIVETVVADRLVDAVLDDVEVAP